MPKIRFGVRYTTDENKDLAYLQLQKDNDIDFARPGELFINEPLNKVYYCDSTTNQFVELNPSALDQLTPEDIKTLYELNPDTNAFTDALKDKAEQAVDKAEANERDIANRDRTNHTGTQTAATISNFDTEVSNNTDVTANTVARHDAVTVVDSSEIDFTLTGQQITASIVAGSIDESKLDASVNASLDLADSSVQLTGDQSIAGTKTFTTALILPNNARINGVEHFYQTTKPTVRGDATALVAGDRWWKTDDGTEWFWNGTYWVSTWVNYTGGKRASGTAAPNYGDATEWAYPQGNKVLVRTASYSLTLPSAGDESNYYYYSLRIVNAINGVTTIYDSTTKMFANGRNSIVNEVINTVVNAEYLQGTLIGVAHFFSAVGSPPASSNIAGSVGWSLIYE